MPRIYTSNKELREKLLSGVNLIADNVASTLGPRGRNVILHKKGSNPIITKDGVTVAKFVESNDPVENLGVQILKQASSKTNEDAGDGTTTATVLARAIFRESQRYLEFSDSSPIEIKRGIDDIVARLVNEIESLAVPISSIEDIENIATISANGDTAIGKLIAVAVDKIGKDGTITIEPSKTEHTTLDIVEGFKFDSGYVSNLFVTDQTKQTCKYDKPYILVTDQNLELLDDLLPVLELVARENKPLVVIAENIEGQALAALIANAARGSLKVAAIRAPRYGEERRNIMQDICTSVNATFISRSLGNDTRNIKLTDLGTAKSIEILKNSTTIVGGDGDFDIIEQRISALREEIKQTDSMKECERIQERITRLSSGVAIIRVGATTEVEMIEKRHRIEDALEAVRSAQQEGILPGGGSTLAYLTYNYDINKVPSHALIGAKIILKAILDPLQQIASNAGYNSEIVLEQIKELPFGKGIDFNTGQIVNLFEQGIIDPAKVTRCTLQNAASVAGTLLTTGYSIIEH